MNKTTNYNLNQWEKSDRVLMEDFNNDNKNIEKALKENADAIAAMGIVTGTYTGNGTYPREINLGFQPKLVILTDEFGKMGQSNGWTYGGIIVPGRVLGMEQYPLGEITENGFKLLRDYVNVKDSAYLYAAFR